jgi:hypothetical protein
VGREKVKENKGQREIESIEAKKENIERKRESVRDTRTERYIKTDQNTVRKRLI